MSAEGKSLTHQGDYSLSFASIQDDFNQIAQRLNANPDEQKKQQLVEILKRLSEFELGRFIIKNSGGFNGYWTYYVILGFKDSKAAVTNPLENFIIHKAPIVLATRQRFAIFQKLLHENIKANSVVCSVPCGLMADLLTLELPHTVTDVRFVGIDLDAISIKLAKELAERYGAKNHCGFFERDAWNMPDMKEKFNILTSNGLNIYEKDNDKVVSLYKSFYHSLAKGGTFIGSALSCPPTMGEKSEWDMCKINLENLNMQKMLFLDILQSTWSHFRSSKETSEQLAAAGFTNIEFYWDDAKMFYSFTATKPAM
ncbi:MAG: SAM-dependent methyltransferase [Gammaproteobacteria bacterium]|jgi:ubiquinone/menaquinone biosynthesis C-methylase UbiE|nr:SAM-dependent methyltransferase [Gammaproteobacteria bacterium]